MQYKKFAAILMAAVIMIQPIPALAADTFSEVVASMPVATYNEFDAEFYAANNPDVVKAFGTNSAVMYWHYLMCGAKEGRMPSKEAAKEAAIRLLNSANEMGGSAGEEVKGEKDIQASILAIKEVFPEGMSWTGMQYSYVWNYTDNGQKMRIRGYDCAAFAMIVSDAVYGTSAGINMIHNPNVNNLRIGDVVKYINNDKTGATHFVVVTDVTGDNITVCEANWNKAVHWGRTITKSYLSGRIQYIVRRG